MVSRWFRPPLRTLTVFVAMVAILAAALGWLGWKVFESDRVVERSRVQERLDAAVDRVSASVKQQLTDLERTLALRDFEFQPLVAGVIAIRATTTSFSARPKGLTLFAPISSPPATVDPLAGAFAEGDAAEFRQADLDTAIRIYQSIARSAQPNVRAAALVRLARAQRKADKPDAALATYDDLSRLGDTPVFGVPAALQAAQGRGTILKEAGRTAALQQEATHLQDALLSGRYPIDPGAWEFRMNEARNWGASRPMTSAEQQTLARSRAADWICLQWTTTPVTSGRRALLFDSQPAIVIWVGTADHLDAIVAGPEYVRDMWAQAIAGQPVTGSLDDENDGLLAGTRVFNSRNAPITGTSLTIKLITTDANDTALFAGRRRLLILAFAVLAGVLIAGSFFIVRSIARERAVARLQSEFVSTVSHEFRTPLTALRQLSEMLSKGRVPTELQRQQAYDILANESERLQHLVESLLDLGRVRSGAFRYEFAAADGAALVADVVAAFRYSVAAHGFEVELQTNGARAPIRADRDALGLALRNLLDNAVKYSPERRTVWVETAVSDDQFTIGVRDQGIGIPPAEQRSIFNEFVRGTAGRDAGIKGTGIGLALARQIVSAHHGEILVDSEPGAGSTFTIRLPLEPA